MSVNIGICHRRVQENRPAFFVNYQDENGNQYEYFQFRFMAEDFKNTIIKAAQKAVAADWRKLAFDIRTEDSYADHVTEEEKDYNVLRMLAAADDIDDGIIDSFTIRQRMLTKITGVCLPLLP